MTRIKITDISKDISINKDEMRKVSGGILSYSHLAMLNNLSSNDSARNNLASSDRELLEQAFGMHEGSLSGGSGIDDVVNDAMSSSNSSWK